MKKYAITFLFLLSFFLTGSTQAQQQFWNESIANYQLQEIAANDSILLIVAENATYYSKDGSTWNVGNGSSSVESFSGTTDLKVKNNRFYRRVKNAISSSVDGINWRSEAGDDDLSDFDIDDNGKLIAINYGNTLEISDNGVYTEYYWNYALEMGSQICYANNRWFIYNDTGCMYSDNGGSTWIPFNINFNGKAVAYLKDVSFIDNKFIAVLYDSTIQYSADGMNWTNANNPKIGLLQKAFKLGNEYFVTSRARNPYKFLRSSDGMFWTEDNFNQSLSFYENASNVAEIVKYKSKYYTINMYNSQILSSHNLSNWDIESENCRFSLEWADLPRNVFENRIHVFDSIMLNLTGDCDLMQYSLNKGNTWKNCEVEFMQNGDHFTNSTLQFGNQIWALLGRGSGMEENIVYRSFDGIHWSASLLPYGNVHSMHFYNNKFYLITSDSLYQSADALNWSGMMDVKTITSQFSSNGGNMYYDFIYEDTLKLLSGFNRATGNNSYGHIIYLDFANNWHEYESPNMDYGFARQASNNQFYVYNHMYVFDKNLVPIPNNLYNLYEPIRSFIDTAGNKFCFIDKFQYKMITTSDFVNYTITDKANNATGNLLAFKEYGNHLIVKTTMGMFLVPEVQNLPTQKPGNTKYYGNLISYNNFSKILSISNPAGSSLTIHIYNLMGTLEKSVVSNQNPVNINLQVLATGVHIVKVLENNQVLDTKKIIVN